MPRAGSDVQVMMPTPERWHIGLLVGLFVLYVAELVLQNFFPIYEVLPWYGFGAGFEPWQLVTRFLVQGPSPFGVLLSLFVLYFFLPTIEGVVGRRQLGWAVLSGAVVGTLLPILMDLAGATNGLPAMGWGPLVVALPVLFGLARPDATILLLVFPVQARWVLWGSLVVALMMLLVDRSLYTYQGVGVWLGVFGWWQLLGPGARRRRLARKAEGIERELRNLHGKPGKGAPSSGKPSNLRVIDGGKSKPQGRQGDDWVH